jgi:hypothetical protein
LDLSCLSRLEFDGTLRKPLFTNHDVVGRADQIRVIEFDAGAFISIVPEHLDPSLSE